jgi:hypothetical protein
MISNTPFIGVLQCRKVIANLELIRFSCKTSNKKGSRLAASLHNKVSVERKSVFVAARGASATEAAARAAAEAAACTATRAAAESTTGSAACAAAEAATRAAACTAAESTRATCAAAESTTVAATESARTTCAAAESAAITAAESTTGSAAESTACTAAESTFTAGTTFGRIALDSFTDTDIATVDDGAFHGFESLASVGIVFECDETEAAAAASFTIRDNGSLGHGSESVESFLQGLSGCSPSQATHEQLHTFLSRDPSLLTCFE